MLNALEKELLEACKRVMQTGRSEIERPITQRHGWPEVQAALEAAIAKTEAADMPARPTDESEGQAFFVTITEGVTYEIEVRAADEAAACAKAEALFLEEVTCPSFRCEVHARETEAWRLINEEVADV